MPNIQNTSTIKEIRTAGGLSISEGFPTRLADSVLPVINVNPKDYRRTSLLLQERGVASGNVTVVTTHATRYTFINSITLSFVKDATCDAASTQIDVVAVVDGVTVVLIVNALLTLTAQTSALSLSFVNPIRLDRASAITIRTPTYTAGNFIRCATLSGYEVESFENL